MTLKVIIPATTEHKRIQKCFNAADQLRNVSIKLLAHLIYNTQTIRTKLNRIQRN